MGIRTVNNISAQYGDVRYLALAPLTRKTAYSPFCAVPVVSFHDGRILGGTGDECEVSSGPKID